MKTIIYNIDEPEERRSNMKSRKIDESSCTRIRIKCLLCESVRELTKEEAEYNHYFNTVSSIYICNRCKNAIEWAKRRMDADYRWGSDQIPI